MILQRIRTRKRKRLVEQQVAQLSEQQFALELAQLSELELAFSLEQKRRKKRSKMRKKRNEVRKAILIRASHLQSHRRHLKRKRVHLHKIWKQQRNQHLHLDLFHLQGSQNKTIIVMLKKNEPFLNHLLL